MTTTHMVRMTLLLGLAVLTGCASTQKVSVQTTPAGAIVSLQRRGDVTVKAGAAGIYGEVGADSFEEEFFSLGNAPVEYEFHRKETEAAVYSPEGGGSVTRHFREGTIRIELNGYQTVERRVRFSGSPIALTVTLLPIRTPEAGVSP